MPRKIQESRGFTLMELLMVMVVLAVIMVIALPNFSNQKQKAQEAALRSDLKLLRTAIANFRSDTGKYPTALVDLTRDVTTANYFDGAATQPVSGLADAPDFSGPYINATTGIPQDPITGVTFDTVANYSNTTGILTSISAATALDGTVYNTW